MISIILKISRPTDFKKAKFVTFGLHKDKPGNPGLNVGGQLKSWNCEFPKMNFCPNWMIATLAAQRYVPLITFLLYCDIKLVKFLCSVLALCYRLCQKSIWAGSYDTLGRT